MSTSATIPVAHCGQLLDYVRASQGVHEWKCTECGRRFTGPDPRDLLWAMWRFVNNAAGVARTFPGGHDKLLLDWSESKLASSQICVAMQEYVLVDRLRILTGNPAPPADPCGHCDSVNVLKGTRAFSCCYPCSPCPDHAANDAPVQP